ncbi:HAD-like domain-containing protein [Lipomyces oligophaga]|uniref:HAD-like domain-containing protein n=1 Tax=Lipomyces oligophaga TaxID=45792 RepID=UPI0034CEEA8B
MAEERKPIRACLFDMDGLLINSEDIYTEVTNSVLSDHGKPNLPWHIKADLQGRPGTEATRRFLEWSELPYSPEELYAEMSRRQESKWATTQAMPGAQELLEKLQAAEVPFALASSSHKANYELKTAHLDDMFDKFGIHKVLGDDTRIPKGRGKPAPDIWLVALASLNQDLLASGKISAPIEADECLVFEDGIPGIQGAKEAGCQIVWVPHPKILEIFENDKLEIVGTKGEILESLHEFDGKKYGME